MSLKIKKENYEYYKKIYFIIWDFLSKYLSQDIVEKGSPINVLLKLEKENLTIARQGLKEGLLDFINWIQNLNIEQINNLDLKLKNENLPNTKKLYILIKDIKTKILKNRKIKNDFDYYAIKELVIDLTNDLPNDERIALDLLISQYENKK